MLAMPQTHIWVAWIHVGIYKAGGLGKNIDMLWSAHPDAVWSKRSALGCVMLLVWFKSWVVVWWVSWVVRGMEGGREEKVIILVSSCWWKIRALHVFLWNRRVVEILKSLLGHLSSQGLRKPSTSVRLSVGRVEKMALCKAVWEEPYWHSTINANGTNFPPLVL